MKIISIVMLLLGLGCFAHAQDCSKVKSGKFKSVLEFDTVKYITTLHRMKNIQTEESNTGVKMQFKVTWTSDCTYELSHPKILKGKIEGVTDDQVLYVKIIKVSATSYTAEVTSNFYDQKMVMEFQILE
jgi:hypothetical protein